MENKKQQKRERKPYKNTGIALNQVYFTLINVKTTFYKLLLAAPVSYVAAALARFLAS
ncbi:hypothetical protein ACVWYF_004405 [Hymenobacter sp. UYAg731]